MGPESQRNQTQSPFKLNKNFYEHSTIIEKDNIKVHDSKSIEQKKSSTLQVRVNTEVFGPSPNGGYRPQEPIELTIATPEPKVSPSNMREVSKVNFGKPVVYKIGEINHYRKLIGGQSKDLPVKPTKKEESPRENDMRQQSMPPIQSPKLLSPEPYTSTSPFQPSPVIPYQRTVTLPGATNRQMSNTVMIVNN